MYNALENNKTGLEDSDWRNKDKLFYLKVSLLNRYMYMGKK